MANLDLQAPQTLGLPLAFHGTVIHSRELNELEILEDCFILVDKTGRIQALQANVNPDNINSLISDLGYAPDVFPIKHLQRGQFLCPGFVDTHNHAPQYAQRGMGRGITLLDWLTKVTFAHEAKFRDTEYAKRMYSRCVSGFLQQGITTASYYGSLHGEATKILADICIEKGQRALVGKCNMNRNSPEWYTDSSVQESLAKTREVIQHIQKIDPEKKLVKPIITPRFAISCEADLLHGLGVIAKENSELPIQTHFNEARGEMEFTRQLFPGFSNETELYKSFGLLSDRTILAHCIYLQDKEVEEIRQLGCGVAHCPISNTTMDSFMVAPIRQYLQKGIKVGLGTDCGGGHSISMLETMRQAFVVSIARQETTEGREAALSLAESFFLATLGGAQVCGLDDKIGNFVVGKEFDALEIHTAELDTHGVMTPVEEEDTLPVIFEKWIMTGDDRNIAKVYIQGRSVKT